MKPVVWWSCHRKARYSDKASRKAIERKHRLLGMELRRYQCPHCDHWHLTKRPPNFGEQWTAKGT